MNKNEFQDLIKTYKEIEEEKRRTFSNRLVQIFATGGFDYVNYPTNLKNHESIINYIDEMHEEKKEIKKYNFSEKEFELIKEIFQVVEYAQDKLEIKKKILPYTSLITSFGILRIIKKLFKNKKGVRVFEIGPGSCYTGALLVKEGYNYSCTDNAQGFYLWQSQILSELNEDFKENFEEKKLFKNEKLSHIPWWEFLELFKNQSKLKEKVDLIICDHALGEVKKECLKYIIKLSKNLLEEKNEASYFLFRAPGQAVFSNYWEILKVFNENDFVNIQFSTFIIFFSKNSKLAKELNIKNIIPKKAPNLIMNKVLLTLNRILQFRILKNKNKELYELKNYNNKVSNQNFKTYSDVYKFIDEKGMISEKYKFFDFINNK